MTDPGPELGGSSHHEAKRSVIRVNEPNQLVGAVAASGQSAAREELKKQSQDDNKDNKKAKRRAKGLKGNSNHSSNHASPPTSPQPQDDKDKKGLRRAKGLKSNSNHNSSSPPHSPQPHNHNNNSKKKKKRERRDFPNEKFGANRPVSVASRASSAGSVPSTGSGSNRGLHNQFPNEKFGGASSSSSRAAAAASPGAHSATTTMIASAGRTSAPQYERVHRQMPNVEPTITIEPNTIDLGGEEEIDVKPEDDDDNDNPQPQPQEEYLVEASLVSMRESDDPAMAAEVLEAKEVTLMDVFQIKGVKCLLGSILGCFCMVLVALIVAIVILTSSSSESSESSIADSAQEFTLVPTLAPSFAPTSSQAGIAGTGLFGNDGEVGRYDECTIEMHVLADSPYPLESPVHVVAADTVSVTFAVSQTWTETATMSFESVYVVPGEGDEDGVCERISSDDGMVGTYTVDCEDDGSAYVLVLVRDDVFSGYSVATQCGGVEEHNIGYSFRLPCACDPEEVTLMEPPMADFVGTPPPDDYADFEPQLGEPLPAATPPPGVAPTDDYIPDGDVPFDDDLYVDDQAPETTSESSEVSEEAESDSGSNAVVVVVVAIAAVLVALGMIAFVPLFLVYMRKKLQQEQARQAAEKKMKKAKGDPDKV